MCFNVTLLQKLERCFLRPCQHNSSSSDVHVWGLVKSAPVLGDDIECALWGVQISGRMRTSDDEFKSVVPGSQAKSLAANLIIGELMPF